MAIFSLSVKAWVYTIIWFILAYVAHRWEFINSDVDIMYVSSVTKSRIPWVILSGQFEGDGDNEENKQGANGELFDRESSGLTRKKIELCREQREFLRLRKVRRKKNFICLPRVNGKITKILQGLFSVSWSRSGLLIMSMNWRRREEMANSKSGLHNAEKVDEGQRTCEKVDEGQNDL